MAGPTIDDVLSLCRRRGFFFPSAEIYGSIAGFYDHGPLGCELRRNIRDAWWRDMVQGRPDVVGMDCSIVTHPQVWHASGHATNFSDPMVDCRESKMRYRADQLFFCPVRSQGRTIAMVSVLEGPAMEEEARDKARAICGRMGLVADGEPLRLRPILDATAEELEKIPSPATGTPGALTAPRDFHLMLETRVGAVADAASLTYLRPETAQGIFVNFGHVVDTARQKIPFGIAQIGRSFRNEITPRNSLFRSREFEQMELEYFIAPDADWRAIHGQWVRDRLAWYSSIGVGQEWLSLEEHAPEKLAHYALACTDIAFRYPFGIQEIEGIAVRGNFDLAQHQNFSGKSLEYFDGERRYLPLAIEPSAGLDRIFLALLCSAYAEDELGGGRRTVLRLHPRLAPIKAGVFPLVKNQPKLVMLAESIAKRLSRHWNVALDSSGAIGRRYRRMDEVGTPFAITVDFQSIDDGTVTLRERDSAEQVRIAVEELVPCLRESINGPD
ncbi:MAG: glycine--tRNA ligase [Puniceicoccales bacterium]|nr:glycine--tRNA ligase [Puniceicoccales bacterium]